MKLLFWATVLVAALAGSGCFSQNPLRLPESDTRPESKTTPSPTTQSAAPVTPDQVSPQSAHSLARALEAELRAAERE
jgi:predicted small lipoprotein YifL